MGAIKVRYRVTYSPDFTEWPKKTVGKGIEQANAETGRIWHTVHLPGHFKQGAEREYGYTPRDPKYQRRKGRLNRGVVLPLVGLNRKGHTAGELKRMVTRVAIVSASSRRGVVKMRAPHYVTFRGRGGTGPDMVAELTAVSEREQRTLSEAYGRHIARALEHEPKKKTIQV